jgi:hypothetical protein
MISNCKSLYRTLGVKNRKGLEKMLSNKMNCDVSCEEKNGGLVIGSCELYFPCNVEDFWSIVATERTAKLVKG